MVEIMPYRNLKYLELRGQVSQTSGIVPDLKGQRDGTQKGGKSLEEGGMAQEDRSAEVADNSG